MSLSIRFIIAGIFLLLLDIYFYQALLVVFKGASSLKRNILFFSYWGFTLVSMLMLAVPSIITADLPKYFRVYVIAFFIMVIISKLIGSVFIGIDDIVRLFRWIVSLFTRKEAVATLDAISDTTNKISRITDLDQL